MSTTTTTTTTTPSLSTAGLKPSEPLRTDNATVPSGPVTARLNFFVPPLDGSPARYLVDALPNGAPSENFTTEAIPVHLHDIRGSESSFSPASSSLARNAFAALQNISSDASINWDDDESIKNKYYPEVEDVLLRALAAENSNTDHGRAADVRGNDDDDDEEVGRGKENDQPRKKQTIIIFDHTIRLADPQSPRTPVLRAHVDQTPKSTIQRVRRHAPTLELAEKYLEGRYRIINVWRPLAPPAQSDNEKVQVQSFPLAFATSSSTRPQDIHPIQHVYPSGYIGEHAGVRHSQQQEWHYWSGMRGHERLLLQCFDSNGESMQGGSGGRTPHTAFDDPRTPKGALPRRSIEVRALVFG